MLLPPDVNQTSLSNRVRKLQEERTKHTIHWEQIEQAKSISPVKGICGICTKEKFYIQRRIMFILLRSFGHK